ncbi:UDP-3-O-(3-hydroxymyristoyl)glucosamine N-acyltransferase [Neptuniibacter sp. QD48_11]|uniref:UDP-3-O-(3-hydroxymyristoyl)glucosamine N-acyltransferase n=1 Tax=unclassified Neptuniibacter TaxID=2630693 RepID=UPI0039F56F5B
MSSNEYTLKQLAEFLSADLHGDDDFKVSALATLEKARSSDLSFIANSKYQKYLSDSQAGAVLMAPTDLEYFEGNALVLDNPYLAYARVSQLFALPPDSLKGIAASANIAESAKVAKTASIAHGVVIGERSIVGDGVVIEPNAVIGADCVIGAESVIKANVTLYTDVHIGTNCLIHSGAVLGADGFGFANEKGDWVKIAQLGGVRVGNNVEVGAGTTIDRGALENTIISDGVILDNQIQIAHNVSIGEKSAIAGCTAVAGSTKIGAGCTIAGACGITGHLSIADGSHITAMSLVTKSIVEPGVYSSGTGMLPHKQWKKNVVRFRQLDDLARRIKSVEDKITEIKGS